MTSTRLLDLVDARDFRTLFIDELGWNNPDRPDLTVDVDDEAFTLTQVAGYKGLRIWHCPVLPPRKTQRVIDVLVGKDNHERLVIFSNEHRQEWRWPRRAQLGSANAKLLVHEHHVGDRSAHLTERLQAIELDFDADITLVALLDKMRDAFDQEAETASVAAARLMGTLYTELEIAGVGEHDATLLLARLLFLLFGDDADMWKPEGLFERYLHENTTADSLHKDLQDLFDVLNTDEKKRKLSTDSPYAQFRYINGGLFSDPLRLPALTSAFHDALIAACKFDWSIISPAVFGSMFQTVKSKEARRHGGEHYTTEENILKTIRPLFLDEYRDRLDRGWDDKAQLTKLHNDLGRGRYIDPACGCGNFLVVSYRELRALELEILKRRRDLDMVEAASKKVERAQLSLDVTGDIKVTLNHFYGIEIEEWPARIAETAMLLVDHLANQRMAQEFGYAPDRLPISIAPTIWNRNSLDVDWKDLVPPSSFTYIMGNPPFIGHKERTRKQAQELKDAWNRKSVNHIDYVTAWYAKSLDYFSESSGEWAFVSTNSVVQGESVVDLFSAIFEAGWSIKFAHRTFEWDSEATGKAGVHCVIIGFTKRSAQPRLFDYKNVKARPEEVAVKNINAYLVDGPNVLVTSRRTPLNQGLPEIKAGSTAIDWDHLVVTEDDVAEVRMDPVARKYLRKYVGGHELINDADRWCLWMDCGSFDPADLENSTVLAERVSKVREKRYKSSREATKKLASTPHLFGERRQPTDSYLAIPQTFAESRRYATAARLPAEVIASIKLFTNPDQDGYLFGLISSLMFITWQKTVGGRLKSDPSFSNSVVWRTFPLPAVDEKSRQRIISAGKTVLDARSKFPGMSLADLYSPDAMPPELVEAHATVDQVVDKLFATKVDLSTDLGRQRVLLDRYARMTGQDRLL
ncbi:class I SAM-dependent DNA methyltransferase [Prescottella equi]|uniref:class I SAM-dependent DNA methyltransferase n=1 Tax=Rhodococcus hoagii TaxID=43767 RepID=UPI002740426C|nr:DNA methyltransferase [Prescottella equi]MDP8017118.1 N-6 DNA methylase [Prescottella equi]